MADTYEGKTPCRNCAGTTRRRGNGECLRCHNERKRIYDRERYASLTGPQYAHLLLQHRRTKALARMAERNERKASSHATVTSRRKTSPGTESGGT